MNILEELLIVAALLTGGVLLGCLVGYKAGVEAQQEKAVQAKVACYGMTEAGKPVFMYITPKEAK